MGINSGYVEMSSSVQNMPIVNHTVCQTLKYLRVGLPVGLVVLMHRLWVQSLVRQSKIPHAKGGRNSTSNR